MDKPTCGTCPYCMEEESGDSTCRRNAPKPHSAQYDPFWPVVDIDYDFCGEHPSFPAWIAERDKPVSAIAKTSTNLSRSELFRVRDKSLSDWMDCNDIPKKPSARSLMGSIAALYEEGLTLEQMLKHRRLRQKKAFIHCAREFFDKWANRTQDVAGYVRRSSDPA